MFLENLEMFWNHAGIFFQSFGGHPVTSAKKLEGLT